MDICESLPKDILANKYIFMLICPCVRGHYYEKLCCHQRHRKNILSSYPATLIEIIFSSFLLCS